MTNSEILRLGYENLNETLQLENDIKDIYIECMNLEFTSIINENNDETVKNSNVEIAR